MPQQLQIDNNSGGGGAGRGGSGSGSGIGWQSPRGEATATSGCVDYTKALTGSELAGVLQQSESQAVGNNIISKLYACTYLLLASGKLEESASITVLETNVLNRLRCVSTSLTPQLVRQTSSQDRKQSVLGDHSPQWPVV